MASVNFLLNFGAISFKENLDCRGLGNKVHRCSFGDSKIYVLQVSKLHGLRWWIESSDLILDAY